MIWNRYLETPADDRQSSQLVVVFKRRLNKRLLQMQQPAAP